MTGGGRLRRTAPALGSVFGSALGPALGPALALALAGCAAGPDYQRPVAPVPAAYRQSPPPGWKTAEAADRLPRGRWWTLYGDSTLSALADQAIRSNQNVAAGEAAVRQAQAQLRQTGAARYPAVSAGFSGSRTTGTSSATGQGGSSGGLSSGTTSSESWRASLDAGWDVDLWGRVRRSVEAGQAQLESAAADLENVRLAVVTELARNYIELRIVDAQRQLLQDTVAGYRRSLDLTRNRYESGVVPRVDVVQAEVQLKSTRAQLIDTELQRAAYESAIAVLVGRPPAAFQIEPAGLAGTAGLPAVPVIPTGLPSALLERRPDIASAERAVAASSARIGVAEAAWFPSLSLSASVGLRGASFSDLLRSPAWFWSPALSLAQSLFDAGERRAVVDQARATHDAQVAGYRQTVLQAFKEVEDNLAALRILEEEIVLQSETLAAARLALQLVTNQYQAGVVNYLNVITAQTSALNSERSMLDLMARRLVASLALVKALGGGWDGAAVAGPVGGSGKAVGSAYTPAPDS